MLQCLVSSIDYVFSLLKMGKKSRRVRTGKKMTDAEKKARIEKDNNKLKVLSYLPISHIHSYLKSTIHADTRGARGAAVNQLPHSCYDAQN